MTVAWLVTIEYRIWLHHRRHPLRCRQRIQDYLISIRSPDLHPHQSYRYTRHSHHVSKFRFCSSAVRRISSAATNSVASLSIRPRILIFHWCLQQELPTFQLQPKTCHDKTSAEKYPTIKRISRASIMGHLTMRQVRRNRFRSRLVHPRTKSIQSWNFCQPSETQLANLWVNSYEFRGTRFHCDTTSGHRDRLNHRHFRPGEKRHLLSVPSPRAKP